MHINFFFRNLSSYTSKRFFEEAARQSMSFSEYDPTGVSIIDERLFSAGDRVKECDIAIFRGSVDDIPREQIVALANWYEERHIYTANPPVAISVAANKWASRRALRQGGVRVPKGAVVMERGLLSKAVAACGGFPILVKFLYGSGGVGVVKTGDMESLRSLYDAYRVLPVSFMLEEYIHEACSGVKRGIIAGGKSIAFFVMNPAEGEFRSNFARGGWGSLSELPSEVERIAHEAVSVCGLKIGSVDIVLSHGECVVLEVNSAPGIELAERVTGKNIAGEILEAVAFDWKNSRKANENRKQCLV